MSENQKHNDYGQQFKNEIERALQSGDFSGLNQLVNDTVTNAVNGVADQVASKTQRSGYYKKGEENSEKFYDANSAEYKETTMYRTDSGAGNAQTNEKNYERATKNYDGHAHGYDRKTPNYDRHDSTRPRPDKTGEFQRSKYDFRTPQTAAGYKKYNPQPSEKTDPAKVKEQSALMKKNGRIAGTLMQVFGGIGIGGFGFASIIYLLVFVAFANKGALIAAVVFFLLSAGGLALLGNGTLMKSRLQTAQRYFEIVKEVGYINIDKLAQITGFKEKRIVKDLRKLIATGVFPQGHLDYEEKCFMLTDDTFKEYQNVASMRMQLESDAMQKQKKELEQTRQRELAEAGLSEHEKQLKRMIEEGQSYIKQIREKNDAIPGEVISEKLFRMESLLKEIFANLEKMPDQMSKMQKLMHYYLPTTLKLVTAYEQFDHVSVPGEDIVNAKREIENTIDTINEAYAELLNKLFADSAMDVTTDAQVLKTMLAKEGLVEDNPMEMQMEWNSQVGDTQYMHMEMETNEE